MVYMRTISYYTSSFSKRPFTPAKKFLSFFKNLIPILFQRFACYVFLKRPESKRDCLTTVTKHGPTQIRPRGNERTAC